LITTIRNAVTGEVGFWSPPSVRNLHKSLVYSPNGDWIAVGQQISLQPSVIQPAVQLLDARASREKLPPAGDFRSLEEVFTWEDAGDLVAFGPDGKRLASASSQRTDQRAGEVALWDIRTRRRLLTLTGHTRSVTGLAFSPDGRRLATSSSDQTVRLWDLRTGHELLALRGSPSKVTAVAFSPDGYRLAAAFADGMIGLWDATPLDVLPGQAKVRHRQ
jgi:WD40 repeat protein